VEQMRAHAKHQAENGRKGGKAKAERKPKSSTAKTSPNQTPSETQPLEDGNVYGDEGEDESDNELYGKCENFFHGPVPEDLIELAGRLEPRPDAASWQDYVQAELEKLWFTVTREQPCLYRSKDGKLVNGRIDLVATDGEVTIGIELDYRQPRLKSIRKVETFAIGMVLLRDPKPVHVIKVEVPVKQMVVSSTVDLASVYDEVTREKLIMTYRDVDVDEQWERFKTKVMTVPEFYAGRDLEGLRLAFQKQLQTAPKRPASRHSSSKMDGLNLDHIQ
jgi:hypothetical protein